MGSPFSLSREGDGVARWADAPWKRWYSLAIWKKARAEQLRIKPFCEECERAGRVTLANTCDHITPHRGDWALFIAGPFQSLCRECHGSIKQAQEERDWRDKRLGPAESSRPLRVGRG